MVFRREEKVAIAKKLDAMGVHRIEAGMPAVSEQDKAAISDIAALGLNAEIFAFARCIPDEIKVVKACGVKGVVVEIPASDHMIKNAYGWSFDRAMKSSIDTTLAAKEAGLYTVFFTIDATRTELNRFLDIVEQVATEGHMDALTMADTVGVCTPEAVRHVVAQGHRPAQEAGRDPLPPGLRSRRGEHDRRARGRVRRSRTRRSPASASAPATCRWRTSCMSLLCLYGVDLGIKTEKFCEVSKLRPRSREGVRCRRTGRSSATSSTRSSRASSRVGCRIARKHAPARVRPVHAGARRPAAGAHRPRQEQRTALDFEWCEKMGINATDEERMAMLLPVKAKSFEEGSADGR